MMRYGAFLGAAAASLLLASCATTGRYAAQPANVPGTLFFANKRGDTISKLPLSRGAVTQDVEACANPHELASSPDGRHIAVACYGGEEILVFDAAKLGLQKRIALGEGARPHGIVWHANGDLYSTAEGRNSIYWIRKPLSSSADVLEYGTGKDGSHMLAVSPDARTAWTTDLGSKTVTRVDLLTRRAPLSVEVGEEPEGIALSPDGQTLWVSARGSNKAFALDPLTMEIRSSAETGAFPLRILVRPQGDFAVTSNLQDASLSVIDTSSGHVTRTISIPSDFGPLDRQQVTILFSPDGSRLYVAETATDSIAEIDFASGKLLRRMRTGYGGDGLAIVR